MTLLRGNLLKTAQRLIPTQPAKLVAYTGQTKLTTGVLAPSYAAPVDIEANVQPVPRTRYEALGLDFQKNYVTVYTATPLRDLKRGGEFCDRIDFNGRRFDVESNTDWLLQNGWHGSICVDTGATP